MQRIQGFSRLDNGSGAPAPACTVTVYEAGTATPASIYADNAAPATPKANPFTAAASGYWYFYAEAVVLYDIEIKGGGIGAPYVLQADCPAGLGNGGVIPGAINSFPVLSVEHTGQVRFATTGRSGLWVFDGAAWVPALDYGLTSLTQAGLPAAGIGGRVRNVIDSSRGLWLDDGSAWAPVLGYAIPSATKAGLPAAMSAGRLRRVSDNQRGLWMENGSAWYPVNGGVVNVIEFGADPTGAADSTSAINTALAVGAGVVVVPPGTYKIASAITMYDRTVLSGYGATLAPAAGYANDSVFRAQNRDDNTIDNTVQCVIQGFKIDLSGGGPPLAGAVLDLVGMTYSRFQDLWIRAGIGVSSAAIRISDDNRAGTSTKLCQQNLVMNLHASRLHNGIDVRQTHTRTVDQLISCLVMSSVFTGINAGTVAGVAWAAASATTPVRVGLLQCLFLGTEISVGSGTAMTGTVPPGAWMLGCDQQWFSSDGTWPGSAVDMESNGRGVGASGTTAAAPLASGGTASLRWNGSIYVKIAAGTVLPIGTIGTYTYTMVQAPAGATLQASLISGISNTSSLTWQAALSGNTITLSIRASAGGALASDLVFRLVQVAP